MKPREQGDMGEWAAMNWLASQGWRVWLPVGHSPDIDLVATRGREIIRVEVKTSTRRRGDRWDVMICTRGGNQSWSGLSKHFDPHRCDYLLVLVSDGRQWFIPTSAIRSRSGIAVGAPKYAPYEVERGRPILRALAG